ncbi:MAG: hypothetical protein Q8K86_09115 [Candidatus Nanopelagicaceae bacterium]|nr:hypothetical protein [Candidatus Nanopelagicaceae bacterium]
MNFGLDVGTKNVVLAYRDEHGKIKHRMEVNGFCRLNGDDAFVKRMLTQQSVPYLELNGGLLALGEKAEELSYAFNQTLQRPMSEGVVNGDEGEAIRIMSTVIRSLMTGVVTQGDSVIYYCIPGNALNAQLNVPYHQKVVQLIVDGYAGKGIKLSSVPINEARALVLGQMKEPTAIGISWGAGMTNISYCLYGLSVFEFSLVGSGDFVDRETARVVGGETTTSVCRYKENKLRDRKFTLLKMPEDNVGRALYINYGILMENVIKGIVAGFKRNEHKARIERPIPIVVGGGTASPEGFIDRFKEILAKQEVPFEVGEIKLADPILLSVADGCLRASELHDK